MAGLVGLAWRIAVAGAWLCISRAEEKPFLHRVRSRQDEQVLGGQWVTVVAVLSAGATWLFVFYALPCLCAKMGTYAQEAEERHGKSNKKRRSRGSGRHEDGRAACPLSADPALTGRPKPRCRSRRPVLTRARRSYALQLARMEHELETSLREVRTQRCALGEAILAEPYPADQELGRLHVTVYEVANYAGEIPTPKKYKSRSRVPSSNPGHS